MGASTPTGSRAGSASTSRPSRSPRGAREPWGITADGTTAWVSDSALERLDAYDLGSGERAPGRDIVPDRRNGDARGLWAEGGTLWVVDGFRDALFAYGAESGELRGEYALDALNEDPRGLWSDGFAIWVSDHGAKRLFAYRLPELAPEGEAEAGRAVLLRLPREDFPSLIRARNNSPRGIWSDGGVMYVADESDGHVYSYHMPAASDARLAALALPGVGTVELSPTRSEYRGIAAAGVTETTVEARAVRPGALVVITPSDADTGSPGHQAAVADGAEITVTVTSADRSRSLVYRVRMEQESGEPCLSGAVAVGFSLLTYRGGSVEELESCARERHVTTLYATHGGALVSYILGAPAFVNRDFATAFVDGLSPGTPLLAKSDGPALGRTAGWAG